MDNVFDIFHDRIIAAIRTGDVICLFFPRLGKTLIVDLRQSVDVRPAVFVENMVGSPEARLKSLERLRPELPLPDDMRLAPWFGFVRTLRETQILDTLLARCDETGDETLAERCREAFQALGELETRFVRAIVRGDMSQTLWQRPRS